MAAVATVFALRATVHFDLNQWLIDRRERKEGAIRALCPHAYLSEEDGTLVVHSSFISPPGTVAWQCQRCGAVTHDRNATVDNQTYWARYPDKLLEVEKKIERLTKML